MHLNMLSAPVGHTRPRLPFTTAEWDQTLAELAIPADARFNVLITLPGGSEAAARPSSELSHSEYLGLGADSNCSARVLGTAGGSTSAAGHPTGSEKSPESAAPHGDGPARALRAIFNGEAPVEVHGVAVAKPPAPEDSIYPAPPEQYYMQPVTDKDSKNYRFTDLAYFYVPPGCRDRAAHIARLKRMGMPPDLVCPQLDETKTGAERFVGDRKGMLEGPVDRVVVAMDNLWRPAMAQEVDPKDIYQLDQQKEQPAHSTTNPLPSAAHPVSHLNSQTCHAAYSLAGINRLVEEFGKPLGINETGEELCQRLQLLVKGDEALGICSFRSLKPTPNLKSRSSYSTAGVRHLVSRSKGLQARRMLNLGSHRLASRPRQS